MLAIVVVPWLCDGPDLGESLTQNTVRLALAYYALAMILRLEVRPHEGDDARRGSAARLAWTLAWAAYLVHVGCAFHFYHHWSHSEAVEHTRLRSGFGPGIFVNYLFTLVWTADVVSWSIGPQAHARRRISITILLHGFMLFVVFNATVVFAEGPVRWLSAGLFLLFAILGLARMGRARPAENAQGDRSVR
jgi:hypothetical protein